MHAHVQERIDVACFRQVVPLKKLLWFIQNLVIFRVQDDNSQREFLEISERLISLYFFQASKKKSLASSRDGLYIKSVGCEKSVIRGKNSQDEFIVYTGFTPHSLLLTPHSFSRVFTQIANQA